MRRVRITPTAAAALGPEVMELLNRDLRDRADRISEEARRMTPRRTGTTSAEEKLEPIRVVSERLDQPLALPPA